MDQVHVIRHKVRVEGRSVRQVAREMGLSRNTVRRYLDQGVAIGVRRAMPRPAPLREAVDVHGPKQAARIFAHVLGAVVDQGHDAVAARLRLALVDGTPVLLAIKLASEPPPVTLDELPPALRTIEVVGSTASAYDALLGGAL